MTVSLSSIHKNIWLTALTAIGIVAIGLLVLHSVSLGHHDVVATGVLADLVVTFPATYCLLIIRPLKVRRWSIMLVFTCSCMVAYLILPVHQRSYILQLRKLAMLAELGLLVYVVSRLRKVQAVYCGLQARFPDPAYHICQSLFTVFGDKFWVKFLASEIGMLRFGLFFWKSTKPSPVVISSKSTYKESGYTALFGVLLSVCVVELGAMHLLIMHYSKTIAWMLSGVSAYGMLFIIGDFAAVVKSPVWVMKGNLLLRTGLRWRALVDINNIASIKKIKSSFQPDEHCFKGGVMKHAANVLITFKHPVSIERLYRTPVTAAQIILSIDQADEFIAKCQ